MPIECDGQILRVRKNLHEALKLLRFIDKRNLSRTVDQKLRELPFQGFIWVDALCINQDDLSERARQVGVMDLIFRQASKTLAYIGPRDAYTQLCSNSLGSMLAFLSLKARPEIAYMESVPNMSLLKWFGFAVQFQRLWFRRAWIVQEAVFSNELLIIGGSPETGAFGWSWTGLLPIIYFLHRTGIVKELCDLCERVLLCQPVSEPTRLLWKWGLVVRNPGYPTAQDDHVLQTHPEEAFSFMLGVQSIRERLGLASSSHRYIDSSWEMQLDRNMLSELAEVDKFSRTHRSYYGFSWKFHCPGAEGAGKEMDHNTVADDMLVRAMAYDDPPRKSDNDKRPVTLLEALSWFRNAAATDQRDKIFAFLSLGYDTTNLNLVVDYRRSISSVFHDTTIAVLVEQKNFTIFSQVQDFSDTITIGLPRWVPDFAAPLRVTPFEGFEGVQIYKSSGGNSSHADIIIEEGGDILAVEGIIVDEVTESVGMDEDDFPAMLQMVLKIPARYASITTETAEIPSTSVFSETEGIKHTTPSISITRIEAFWRTLIADVSPSFPACYGCGEGFAAWLAEQLLGPYLAVKMALGISVEYGSSDRGVFEAVVHDRLLPGLDAWSKLVDGHVLEHPIPLNEMWNHVPKQRASWFHFFLATTLINGRPPIHGRQQDPSIEVVENDAAGRILSYTVRAGSWPSGHLKPDSGSTSKYATPSFLPSSADLLKLAEWDGENNPRGPASFATFRARLDNDSHTKLRDFTARMKLITKGRKLLRTKKGLLGLGPSSTGSGHAPDQIWILKGSNVPFILRRDGNQRYEIVGEAYVHGIMNGEVASSEAASWKRISLS
jgi:hypothetical protein